MWIDISPLRKNKDFRYVYFGQLVSFFGTMMTFVALPFQAYQLTNSTLAVGLLGIVELIPLLLSAFIGGALADVMDRKALLLRTEAGLTLCCLILMGNALLPHPQLWLLYVIAALMSALNGLHRPSLDAMVPRLVSHEEIQATSVLASFKGAIGMIGGPAIAGICIAGLGLGWTYGLDCLTFLFSLIALYQIQKRPPLGEQEKPSFKSIKEAVKYAIGRHELIGTYLVDFTAMVFAMPNALFPALAQFFGGTQSLGWLYSAPAIGALIVTIFSGWTKNIHHHGAAVCCAAMMWGIAIAIFGMASNLIWALCFLILAGAADCVSGIFRTTIWNETIPDRLRGRMASLEMVSYMSGPLIGNAQAGLMASIMGTHTAIMVGGSLCTVAVAISVFLLPNFWKYQKQKSEPIQKA